MRRALFASILVLAACQSREAQPAPAGLDAAVGLGLTVGEVRRGNEELAKMAGPAGYSMEVCRRLEAAGLAARCTNITGYAGASTADAASFELPEAARGRGMVKHYESDDGLARARDLAKEGGFLMIANPRTRIVLLGGTGMTDEEYERARAIVMEKGQSPQRLR